MQITQQRYYTPEEYLELEEAADYKSEYIDGQIISMAGGTANHNLIGGNFYAVLNIAFRQQEYEVFNSDMRLWIHQKRIYTYPDVTVIVGEPEFSKTVQILLQIPKLLLRFCLNLLKTTIAKINFRLTELFLPSKNIY